MIGECASLAPRKNSLNLFNLIMSLLAGIFMIVSCASYSANVKTVQNLSFMVQKKVSTTKVGDTSIRAVQCYYVSLQGVCSAYCDDSQTVDSKGKAIDMPSDDKLRECATGEPDWENSTLTDRKYKSTLVLYKTFGEAKVNALGYNCKEVTGVDPLSVVAKQICTTFDQCQTNGNTTVAFAVIGCIGALFSMVAFAWRMNSDGVCPKLISIGLAIGTFIACVVAFAAFQPCMSSYYATYTAYSLVLDPTSKDVVTYRPGVGGAMAVTSFVFFIYVMFMSVFIPSAGPAGSDAGLDNKAPQV